MKHKWIVLFTVMVLLSLLIMPIGIAQAQDPQPPRPIMPTTFPHYPPPVSLKQSGDTGKGAFPFASPMLAQHEVQAALALGQPGLSYRYVQTFGTTVEPYLADGVHLDKPNGLFIDSSNNLYTVEEHGYRLLKFSALGANTMIIGHAGQPWHHDDFLASPVDGAVDSSGNIWVVIQPAIKEFDSSGNLIRIFPETNPWEGGTANDRFDRPWGIAFDANGDMYVSDMNNHRIQVYDVSGGTPTYVETIGETGVPHSDNNGFNYPGQIAFDSLGRLYVMDSTNNFRVQRCTKSGTWTCSTFFGETGVQGNDLSHLSWALGLTIKNDIVYIADGANYRVLKCTLAGVCSHFAGVNGVSGSDNSHFRWISDVAVDSSGNVFVSDLGNYRIQKFNSAGIYQSTTGVTGVPYLTDTNHLNTPWGVAVNPTGDVYAVEHLGYRLLKYNSAGSQQWTVGTPGVDDGSGGQLGGGYLAGPEGNPAVDVNGRVYVADTPNNRVQIYNANGSYFTTLGTGWGQGNYEFSCPEGVAISPVNGDVYVVDMCNQRIQIYTSALVYKATLGETGVEGSDNSHFRWLRGVTVGSNGNIFVADSDNHRVQKCNFTTGTNYTCSTFAGETGVAPDSTYDHIHPLSVAVDANGRVYVADEWNSRVMVYDSTGAFLTSIGGDWSSNSGGLIGPSGVAVDSAGNVYVTDRDNHRIQKFAPGVPGWQQMNLNGFGTQAIEWISTLGTFNGALYAGTTHWWDGAQIWRSTGGSNWSALMTGGFGNTANYGIDHLMAFNGKIYAGTWSDEINGGEIWRSSDGTGWSRVVNDGFDSVTNAEVYRFAVFNNNLYASTWGYVEGGDIWRSDTGDSGDWQEVVDNGFGETQSVLSFEVFNGNIYAGTLNPIGGQIWRSDTGNAGDWAQINTSGFGSADNSGISALATFNGYLYAITYHVSGGGAQVWRCQQCDNTDWEDVTGSWSADNRISPALETANNALYAVLGNSVSGLEVWQTKDGVSWMQIGFQGLEGSNSRSTYWDNPLTVFNNELYLGNRHIGGGGQIWKLPKLQIYISGILKDAYSLNVSQSQRASYAGIDSGPVQIENTDGTPIVAGLNEVWKNNGVASSSFQFMAMPSTLLSNKYVFPAYNNVTLNEQLRFGNVGNADTTVTVTIGGQVQGTYLLHPSEQKRVNYAGVDSGPVVVEGSDPNVPIVAAIRDAWFNGPTMVESFSQLVGLPSTLLSNKYVFPAYNNVNLNDQLRFGNVGNADTTVTVTIGGQVQGSYLLHPSEQKRVNYPLDNGPVVVEGSDPNVPIIAAIRSAWFNGNTVESWVQLMGLPASQVSHKYVFPAYDNVSVNGQLRFGNIGNADTTVTVTIGGNVVGSYLLHPSEQKRVSYSLDTGPVVIEGSDPNVPIIAALRDALFVNGVVESFAQLMGLPASQLSDTFLLPAYNNVNLSEQLRFGVP